MVVVDGRTSCGTSLEGTSLNNTQVHLCLAVLVLGGAYGQIEE